MFLFIIISLIAFILVVVLNLLSMLLAESSLLAREELTSYECGFEHHSLSRVPFSLRYFFLTLIFLLFDLEIILLLFSPYTAFFSSAFFSLFLIVFFVSFLFIGLLYEWNDGSLEWII